MVPPITPSDAELMGRLKAGDTDALGVLYTRYGRLVGSVIRQLAMRATLADAQDLCQETFLVLWETRQRYREEGKLRAWLIGIAAHKARAFRRLAWVRRALGAGEPGVTETMDRLAAEDSQDRLVRRIELDRALARLSHDHREVLVLAEVQGLDGDEIADALGIAPATVFTRLFRARAALRKLLAIAPDAGGRP